MQKVKIGGLQLLTILVNVVYGKAIGYTNGTLTRAVGNDAWLAMILAFATGVLVLPALVWLSRRYRRETPMQYIPRLLGRPLGALVMLLLALFFLVSFLTSATTITQHINDYLMTETPLVLFVVGYTVLIAYGVYLGLEVTARLSVLGVIMAGMLNLSMVVGSVQHMDMTRLLPLFDHGVLPTIIASARADTDVGMVITTALMLLPLSAAPTSRWLSIGLWGLGVGLLMVVTWSLFELTVLGPEVTAQYLVSCMQMARAAELSIYLHRYEMIMVVMFVYSVITQSIVCLYCTVGMLDAVLPFKIQRGYLIGAVALLSIGPQYFLAHDRDRYGAFLAMVWPPFAVALAFGIPLFLCLVALFRPPATTSGTKTAGS